VDDSAARIAGPTRAGARRRVLASADGADGRTQLVTVLGVRRPIRVAGGADERVAAIAGHQRGRISRAQLRCTGLSDDAIDRRVRKGQLRRQHRGVYAVGHTAPAPLADETAALLACGEHAVLSRRSAAVLWGLVPEGDGAIHVTIRSRHGPPPAGVRLHRTNRLNRSEVEVQDGLPVTSVIRTLFDLAEDADTRTLEYAVEEAQTKRLVSERELRAAARRFPGRRGPKRIREIL
jgi:predicted transcriptional regulator of viral defense system